MSNLQEDSTLPASLQTYRAVPMHVEGSWSVQAEGPGPPCLLLQPVEGMAACPATLQGGHMIRTCSASHLAWLGLSRRPCPAVTLPPRQGVAITVLKMNTGAPMQGAHWSSQLSQSGPKVNPRPYVGIQGHTCHKRGSEEQGLCLQRPDPPCSEQGPQDALES